MPTVSKTYHRCALIMAGGVGARMGAGKPKQMIALQGKPILVHTLQRFFDFDPQLKIAVVLHESLIPGWEAWIKKWLPQTTEGRISACPGGESRTDSVFNGLKHLHQSVGLAEEAIVAIHDGVRPFVTKETLENAFSVAKEKGNAVACVPVKSSLRRKTRQGSQAVDRSDFFHVQTPQVFNLGQMLHFYEARPEGTFTDDASLAEASGLQIEIVMGGYDNIKITTPEDLAIAEIMLRQK